MTEVLESVPPPTFLAPPMAEIVVPEEDSRALQQAKLDRIREFEDAMLMRASSIVEDAMSFADIDKDHPSDNVPDEWLAQCGGDRKRAVAKMRVAKAAWEGTRDMPGGIKIAAQVMTSIIKARSMEKSAPKQLNVQVVNISAPLPDFAVMDVEESE